MVVSYTSKFDHVVYGGNEGTLVLTEDKLSFQPIASHKKKLHWNWDVVKSHQVDYAAMKPTWIISVTVRGFIQETMKFELDSKDAANKLQNEANKRSGLEHSAAPIPPRSSQPTKAPATFAAANNSGKTGTAVPPAHQKIEALKHQMFDPKDNNSAIKKNKDLETLESVHVSDLRKKLGAMLPAPPPAPKAEPTKEDPFQRQLQEARRSLNSSMNLDYDASESVPVKPIDPNKQKLLMAKLNLHPPSSQSRSQSPPKPPKPSAFRPIDEPTTDNNNASSVIRPKPVFLQELNKTVPEKGPSASGTGSAADRPKRSTKTVISHKSTPQRPAMPSFLQELKSTDQTTQLKTASAEPKLSSTRGGGSGGSSAPPTLMGELQAKLAANQKSLKENKASQISKNVRRSTKSSNGVPALVSLATGVQATAPVRDDDGGGDKSHADSRSNAGKSRLHLQDDTMLVAPQNLEELSSLNRESSSKAPVSNMKMALVAPPSQQQQQQRQPSMSEDESLKDGSSSSTDEGVLVTSLTAPPAGWTVSENSSSEEDENSNSDNDEPFAAASAPPAEEYSNRDVRNEDDDKDLPPPLPFQDQHSHWAITAFLVAVCCVVILVVVLVLTLGNVFENDDDNKDGPAASLAPSVFPTLPVPPADIPTGSPGIPTISLGTLAPSDDGATPAPVAPTVPEDSTSLPSTLQAPTTNPYWNVPVLPTAMATALPSVGVPQPPSPAGPVSPTTSPTASLTTAPQSTTSLPTSLRTSQPTQLSTSSPQASITDLPTILSSPTQGAIVGFPDYSQPALEDPESPQSLARDWLLGDPNLSTYEDWRQLQRFALGTFYYSFNGDDWPLLIRETWMAYEGSECDWFSDSHTILITIEDGVAQMTTTMDANASVCNENGRYISLEVYNGNAFGTQFHTDFVRTFVGTMPPEVSLLTSLKRLAVHTDANVLDISMGDLLPTQFQNLVNLTDLDLSDSFLKDWDFEALLNIPNLEILDVASSDFGGALPTSLGLMTRLSRLDVSNAYDNGNQMMPSEIGLLTDLTHLSLSNIGLTGLFPSEFAFLRNLKSLELSDSNMQSFPPTTLVNLEVLDMSSNNLESTLPVEVAFYTSLRLLDLSNNSIQGSLPIEIGLLTTLETLNLFRNSLSSTLPEEIGLATSLRIIDLEANMLTGVIPSTLLSIPDLQHLSLRSNALTGSLAQAVGSLTALEALVLGDNTLTGPLPTEIGLLAGMFILDMDTNFFTGTIGTEIGLMTDLTLLDLKNNDLVGTIPQNVGLMQGLQSIHLSRNRIGGSIPTEIGTLGRALSELVLDWNLLSGKIPSEVGLLTSLTAFTARGYTLRGPIPEEVGGMKNLEIFLLGGNPLIGTLPTTIGLLSSLEHLSLNLTTITGTIPSQLGTLSSLTYLYLNGNDMGGSMPKEVCALSLQVMAVDCAAVACDCGCDCFG